MVMPWNMPRPGGARLWIVDALIAPGAEHTLGDAASTQGIEIIQHVAQAVGGHELQHDGVRDFFAGVELRLLLQVVVAHHEAEGRQGSALGALQHRLGHAVDEISQHVRMDGADHGIRALNCSPLPSSTPTARPPDVSTLRTSALQRTSPP